MHLEEALRSQASFTELFRSDGFVLVDGIDTTTNDDLLRLCHSLGELEPRRGPGAEDEFVRRVEFLPQFADETVFDEDTANFKAGHTDGWGRRPPHMVVLCCVRPAAHGGESHLLHVRDIIEAMSAEDVATLRTPLFPSGCGRIPILFGPPHDPRIQVYVDGCRYFANASGQPLREDAAEVLDRLESLILRLAPNGAVHLRAGQCVVIDNWRCLHGRTAFSRDAGRLIRNVYVGQAHHRFW